MILLSEKTSKNKPVSKLIFTDCFFYLFFVDKETILRYTIFVSEETVCKSEITKSIDSTLVDASLRKKLPKKSSSIIVIEFRALEVYEKDKMLNLPVRKNHQFF